MCTMKEEQKNNYIYESKYCTVLYDKLVKKTL